MFLKIHNISFFEQEFQWKKTTYKNNNHYYSHTFYY